MGYKKIDVKATLASKDNLGGGVPFLTIGAGKRVWLRILPPREDHPNDTFFLAVPLHYEVGRNKAIVPCLLKLRGAYCPVCEYNSQVAKRTGKESENATTRCLMNVVVLDEEGNPQEEKVNVWTAPQRAVTDLLDEMADLPEKQQDITDLKKGRDIWIKRRGSGKNKTTWKAGLHDEASAFPMPELAEQAFDLSKIFPERDEETMINLLTGGSARGEDPWEELEEGEERKALPKGRRRVVEDDDEEEPEEGEFTEAENEEEEPKPKPRRRAAPEPEDDEEPEEEEKPKPRARRVVKPPKEAETEEDPEEEEEDASPRARLAKHLKGLK